MVLDVLRTLGRRWYIVGLGLLVTCALVFGAYRLSPPKYQASALVLMLPARSEVTQGGNPFLLLDGLEQPAGILTAYFSSEPAQTEVKKISPTAEYEVALDDTTRGPVIAVRVTDESPQSTMKTLNFLLQRLPDELSSLQRQVDARGSTVIGSMPLTVDLQPQMSAKNTVRAMIAGLVAGLLGTVLGAVALDNLLLRRRRRSSWDSLFAEEETTAPPASPASDADEVPATALVPLASREESTAPPASDDDDVETEESSVVPAADGWSWGKDRD